MVMDHPVWPVLPLLVRLHPNAVPAAETPVLRFPAAPWLLGLDDSEQRHESDAVLPDEVGEQVPVESRSATGAIACASAEQSALDTARLDQAGRIQEVALSQIKLRRAHRRIVTDTRSLEALISSIDAIELRQPLLVRPVEGDLLELVTGYRRFTALQALGHDTARVEVREMTERQAAESAFVDDLYHRRRRFWECALQIEEIRTCIAAEDGVPVSAVENKQILASLGMGAGRRSLASHVSECLGALALLTPAVLALAEVERDDPRLARTVSRPIYRKVRDAPDDRARAAIIYHAVHGHPTAWEQAVEANAGFDAASVISTRATLVSVVMEVAWARVPPEHVKAVRRRARAELDRLLREPPVRLSLPALTARAGEPRTQPD